MMSAPILQQVIWSEAFEENRFEASNLLFLTHSRSFFNDFFDLINFKKTQDLSLPPTMYRHGNMRQFL